MPLGSSIKPVFKPKAAPSIATSPQNVPRRGKLIALLGKPGMGKTSLAAQFPNPYFVIDPTETGILDLMDSGAVNLDFQYVNQSISDWPSLVRFNDELITGRITLPPDRSTLVYESLSGFEQQAITYCTQIDYNGNATNKEGGYHFFGKGDRAVANKYWAMLMKQFGELAAMDYNVLFTGHSEVKNEKNVSGADYMVETCKCSGPVWGCTDYIFSNVFFIVYDVEVQKEGGPKSFNRPKALENAQREVYGMKTPYHAAKNRCRMEALINKGPVSAEGGPADTYARLCKACEWDAATLRNVRR